MGHVLIHDGTGEMCPLDGQWQLAFDFEGNATLHNSLGECEWATTFFTKSLHVAERRLGVQELIISTKGSPGSSVWRQDVFNNQFARRCIDVMCPFYRATLEVFISALPRQGQYVRWSAPSIITRALSLARTRQRGCCVVSPLLPHRQARWTIAPPPHGQGTYTHHLPLFTRRLHCHRRCTARASRVTSFAAMRRGGAVSLGISAARMGTSVARCFRRLGVRVIASAAFVRRRLLPTTKNSLSVRRR